MGGKLWRREGCIFSWKYSFCDSSVIEQFQMSMSTYLNGEFGSDTNFAICIMQGTWKFPSQTQTNDWMSFEAKEIYRKLFFIWFISANVGRKSSLHWRSSQVPGKLKIWAPLALLCGRPPWRKLFIFTFQTTYYS